MRYIETNPLFRVVAEILLCVKHLADHIPVENALIAIFGVFCGAK